MSWIIKRKAMVRAHSAKRRRKRLKRIGWRFGVIEAEVYRVKFADAPPITQESMEAFWKSFPDAAQFVFPCGVG